MANTDTRFQLTEQMFAAVGRAITEWSFVEHYLSQVFSVCLGRAAPLAGGHGGIHNFAPQTPRALFYAIESFHVKRTLVDAAVAAYVMPVPQAQPLLEEWGILSKKARGLSQKRNKLAHWTVWPAQRTGTGADDEPIAPPKLLPTFGSPRYWEETSLNPPGKALTLIHVGHIETAFRLYGAKVWAFAQKLTDTQELRDKDVQRALRLLELHSQLDPDLREHVKRVLASLE